MSVIRTAVIGFGTAGRVFHAPLIAADPRYSLDAIVTGSPERARLARQEYPGTGILAGTDALFAGSRPYDLVVIGSPNASHAPLAHAAIEAGSHVVIDKPIAVTAAGAREVVAAAKAAGRVLTVFQNRRWDGDFLTLRDVVERGELGEVRQFDSAFEWWSPRVGDGWKDVTGPSAGGGILYDLGPHLIDQALQLFGEVSEVHAELDRRRPGAVSDDESFLTLRHVSGVRTRLWMSAVAPAPRPRFRVTGSRAVFRSDGLDPQEAQSLAGLRPGDTGFGLHADGRDAVVAGPDGTDTVPLRAGDYREFYRRLATALHDGGPPPVDPADSIRALDLIEQAVRG
ncbi:Gfo/Idh/MocA family protein [Streptomyces paludis]|uniref:Oxidoreductase n=1 Tax=Streptomyces paludis TaxID=2282738 RepID=A0A345HZ01_9ACTN|nr:Gfo/Idh/MocA family oxidoreductase [Streptomyces paludis]AXG81925.1 oxidoreductase [Streptomyces paludis]